MSDFNEGPWSWIWDRFMDQNQVGKDVDNSGGILGPVGTGISPADGTNAPPGPNLFEPGSSQDQTGIAGVSNQPSVQPFAWSDDHGGTVYISRPDNSLEIRTGGSLAWRNNNPGNLRSEQAEIGQNNSTRGGLAIFENPEAGSTAQNSLVFGPAYRNLTIAQAINKYAPASENDTEAYISDVERRAGLDRATVLNTLNGGQRADILGAIRAHEGVTPGTSSMAYYNPFGRWGD
jgi:hypothetical protein